MDDRTLRAALAAAAVGLVGIGGVAWFLGVAAGTAVAVGVGAGVAFGGLIIAVARRADSLARPDDVDTTHLNPTDPGDRP